MKKQKIELIIRIVLQVLKYILIVILLSMIWRFAVIVHYWSMWIIAAMVTSIYVFKFVIKIKKKIKEKKLYVCLKK